MTLEEAFAQARTRAMMLETAITFARSTHAKECRCPTCMPLDVVLRDAVPLPPAMLALAPKFTAATRPRPDPQHGYGYEPMTGQLELRLAPYLTSLSPRFWLVSGALVVLGVFAWFLFTEPERVLHAMRLYYTL